MDVDVSQSSGQTDHGKNVVAADSPNQRTLVAVTPYNLNPQTPRGKEIVSWIRRASPGLLRVLDTASSSSGFSGFTGIGIGNMATEQPAVEVQMRQGGLNVQLPTAQGVV